MPLSNKTNFALSGVLLAVSLSLSVLPNANADEKMMMYRSLPAAYYSDAPKTDAELTSTIKDQLSQEKGVDFTKINVETVNGAVTLSGTVTSKAEIDRVLQIARSAGAAQVVESTVSTEKPPMDMPMSEMPTQSSPMP